MKTKKILIVTLMAIVFCLTFALGAFAGCQLFPKDKDDAQTDDEKDVIDNGGMAVEENVVGNEIMLMSAAIPLAEYEDYGITPLVESAYMLSATVTPANATYKDVEWSIAFKTPTSTWAKGKNVSDYVTLAATGASATLSCKSAFGEQIIVTVKSIDNSKATVTCTVDYRKRVTDATVSLQPATGSAITLGTNANTVSATVACNTSYTVKVNVTEGVGTLASGYVIKDSQPALIDNFFTVIGTSGNHMEPENRLKQQRTTTTLNLGRSDFQMLLLVDDWACDMDLEDEYTDRVISAMAGVGTSKNLGVWHLLLTDSQNNQLLEKTFYFAINISALRIAVNGVGLNLPNVEF